MVSKFQQRVRADILEELHSGSRTIAELANKYRFSYDSTRNAVQALRDEGIVKDHYEGNARNIKYSLATNDDGPNKLIPKINHMSGISKLNDLVRHRFNSSSPANQAIYALPRDVTRLMMLATKAKRGMDISAQVNMVRKSMENNVELLRNIVNIYDQILENGRNFEPQFLMRYPNDTEFDEDAVNEAYQFYFNEES